MAMIGMNSFDIEQTGRVVQVPNNDIARCMYYLSCVCNTVECNEGQIERYTDYENYWKLSPAEHQIVFRLCITLSPDEFEDKIFFQNDAMCGNSGNEFYKIGQVQNRLFVVRSLMVAGRTRRVTNIMTYKQHWMMNNYYGPMSRLADRFNPQRQLMRAIEAADCTIS
ncbi:unnamed protein product [Adineta ricciae]|uniref:Uncharacterized protein n=1 Tax=Adineta ricciae TaxID=249248 RepID=A0A814I953_ADIRI|nr:unnamed protein product [Adineta ricciae]CAF1145859.1 unnamed protein product [Adineta ricciae]